MKVINRTAFVVKPSRPFLDWLHRVDPASGGWYRVPSTWPGQRGLDAFERWFEWSSHSMVVDLCDHPISHDVL
jgi:hypothetical protein